MKNAGLKCDICGATESQSGKPFTAAGLGAHKAHLHADEKAAASLPEAASSLVCDLCGVGHNARGEDFRTEADVLQHKRRVHGASAKAGKAAGPIEKRKPGNLRKAPTVEANHVKFCPQCGFNMEIVNAAMALVNGSIES